MSLIIVFSEAAPKNYKLRKSDGADGMTTMTEHLLAFYIIIGVLGGLLGFVVIFACCLRCRDSCKGNQDEYAVST